ncbi:DUF2726 domain-containing protein [Luteolibacter sp. LG18]|uniref:DUF2726 domain-containing protein n=1 Tax=Luteolibacter sp. LG18 TaxID=2819286 RepID=UPI002B28E413|nr:hypothetical protein llg_14220 [Luteolibacter sp. LG18]
MTNRSPQAGRMERLFGWLPSAKSRTAPQDTEVSEVERTWRHKTLLTQSELSFLHVLNRVVQDRCLILTKARMADLFGFRRGEEASPVFEKIGSQHVDFVLCDPRTSEMLVAIEVDERAYVDAARAERNRFMDRLFAWNRLPLIRVPSSFLYAPEKLRRELSRVLGDARLQAIGN